VFAGFRQFMNFAFPLMSPALKRISIVLPFVSFSMAVVSVLISFSSFAVTHFFCHYFTCFTNQVGCFFDTPTFFQRLDFAMLLIKPFSKFAINVLSLFTISVFTVMFTVAFSPVFRQKESGGYAGKQNAD